MANEKLSKSPRNLLRCWLYDGIYQHLPRDREPSAKDLLAQAVKLKRPEAFRNMSIATINTRIKSDITTGVWKIPPTPGSLAVEAFPNWKIWHQPKRTPATGSNTASSSSQQNPPAAPKPTPAEPTAPAPAPPTVKPSTSSTAKPPAPSSTKVPTPAATAPSTSSTTKLPTSSTTNVPTPPPAKPPAPSTAKVPAPPPATKPPTPSTAKPATTSPAKPPARTETVPAPAATAPSTSSTTKLPTSSTTKPTTPPPAKPPTPSTAKVPTPPATKPSTSSTTTLPTTSQANPPPSSSTKLPTPPQAKPTPPKLPTPLSPKVSTPLAPKLSAPSITKLPTPPTTEPPTPPSLPSPKIPNLPPPPPTAQNPPGDKDVSRKSTESRQGDFQREAVPGSSNSDLKVLVRNENVASGSVDPTLNSTPDSGGIEIGKYVANWWETPERNDFTSSQESSNPELLRKTSELLKERVFTSLGEASKSGLQLKLEKALSNMDSLFLGRDQSNADAILPAAPLFTSDLIGRSSNIPEQCAVFGRFLGSASTDAMPQRYLMLNTNIPWTAFICGVQGAGKSHSLTVMLENCLIPNETIGVLEKPLAGVVFHYSPYNAAMGEKPCEAAYLANPNDGISNGSSVKTVTVLVSRSNLANMKAAYDQIPGVKVKEFLLNPGQLTIKTMHSLMSVQKNNDTLYMQTVNKVLREMANERQTPGEQFDYQKFKDRILDKKQEKLSRLQLEPLQQRLALLESFIGPKTSSNLLDAIPGTLTIVDLTCPFIDPETACILFGICNELFATAKCDSGKIIALDEAHRYMSNDASAPVQQFAKSIIANIRVQRHIGIRTIISTQDPLIHPELLELSSMVIIHRFSSPRWFETLKKHIGFQGPPKDSDNRPAWEDEDAQGEYDMFKNIMGLYTGEAYVFCPQLVTRESGWGCKLKRFGNEPFKTLVRPKITFDGGASKKVLT